MRCGCGRGCRRGLLTTAAVREEAGDPHSKDGPSQPRSCDRRAATGTRLRDRLEWGMQAGGRMWACWEGVATMGVGGGGAALLVTVRLVLVVSKVGWISRWGLAQSASCSRLAPGPHCTGRACRAQRTLRGAGFQARAPGHMKTAA